MPHGLNSQVYWKPDTPLPVIALLSSFRCLKMAITAAARTPCFPSLQSIKSFGFSPRKTSFSVSKPKFAGIKCFSSPIPRLACTNSGVLKGICRVLCSRVSTVFTNTTHYEFYDGSSDVELRLELGDKDIPTSRDVFVDANDNSLAIKVQRSGSLDTLMETSCLYEKIRPAETIWYLDDNQLVVNLKKQDPDLKWPDIEESWESLTVGVMQLLKGTSIYLVGDSTEINKKVARELAVGLGYTPLDTKELLETFAKQAIDSWVSTEGSDAVAEAESAIIESLSSHVRATVATLGGRHGAATRANNWRHLYAGFTVCLSQCEVADEDSAKEEARRQIQDGSQVYSNAEVVVKLGGSDAVYTKTIAQASLSALKRLILSDKKLPGKKSLYIRLGCRGDWPNIKPPGWDPSAGVDESSPTL